MLHGEWLVEDMYWKDCTHTQDTQATTILCWWGRGAGVLVGTPFFHIN